jgi:glycosyltransferase involved in cell wall biosynthesis
MKVLLVTMYFPPAGGGGVQRPLKFATHLPSFGIETHVLAPDDPKWVHRDEEATPPTQAWVHRVRYHGPRGRIPSEDLYALEGLDRLRYQAGAVFRRALVPDKSVTWAPAAIPAAIRIVKREGIDAVLTTSPPNSINLIGAAVKKATGVKWIADLRDPLIADADNPVERLPARLKENVQRVVARLVASQADAIVTAWDGIADEIRAYEPKVGITVIPNGADYDDFEGLAYKRSPDRFRITHTGSFFGKRDPRPFLTALKESGLESIVARFVGELAARDREWAETLGLGDRLELLPFGSRHRSLAYQRDSEALLLLLPQAGERGTPVLPGKIFEYLAAERPILAAVPPKGAAANLIRESGAGVVVPPDDVAGIREALVGLEARWRAGRLNGTPLPPELRDRISRRTRVEELSELLLKVV